MNKTKNWKFIIPSCLLMVSLVSCAFAKGDYTSDKTQTEGISLSAEQKTGSFVYRIKTTKANQTFSKLNISFNDSRITNLYGEKEIKVRVSICKTADFAEADTIFVEEKVPVTSSVSSLQFSFDSKGEQLKQLKATELYVKTEIIVDEASDTFNQSWIVLGSMRIFGGEQLDTGEEESASYLDVDFSKDGLSTALEHYAVKVGEDNHLVPETMGVAGYLSYKISPKDNTNTFQSMQLKISDSILKNYAYTEKDEEGKDVEMFRETGINVYVSTTEGAYPTKPSASFKSTNEGLTEAVIDLTSAVERISVPDVYVRVELITDENIPSDQTCLALGKLAFVGEESQKVDSYLSKDFKEGIADAVAATNFTEYKEKAVQTRIVLKGDDKCEYYTIEYDAEGNPVEKKSTVCTWTEKGIKYNNNWVVGLTEEQLQRVLTAYEITLDSQKSYTGTKQFLNKNVKVVISEVFSGYYEMVYDVSETFGEGQKDDGGKLSQALKNEAIRFSDKVFQDFNMQGGGNVVYVNHDGQREIFVHEGKTIIRVSDNKILRK